MIKEWKVKRFSIFLCLALALTCSSAAEALEINGGTTWNGWTSVGFSNQLGIYGSGATTDVYEIYTASFLFNNETKSGGAVGGGPTGGVTGFGTGSFSTGSFVNGNSMLGIGVRRVSGSAFSSATIATVRFDLDNDNYVAASSVGGTDGRTSFTQYSHFRDLRFIRILRARNCRIHTTIAWMDVSNHHGGGTRGPSFRPQTPTSFPLLCSVRRLIPKSIVTARAKTG